MNLADWLRRPRPAAAEQLALAAALAQAVEEGHKAGHQYGGWSPSRVPILGDGNVDLAGIADGAGGADDPPYSAPEVSGGGTRSPRADVYSAGVILYEILAGAHPFGGGPPRGLVRPLREVRPELSHDLTDAVSACLERDPDWRPQDLSYVVHVLREMGARPTPPPRDTTPAAKPKPAPAPPPPSAAPAPRREAAPVARRETGPSFHTQPPSRSNQVVLYAAAGLVLLAGIGLAVWTLWKPATPVVTGPGKPTATAPPDAGTPQASPAATSEPATPKATVPAATLPPVATSAPANPGQTLTPTSTPTRVAATVPPSVQTAAPATASPPPTMAAPSPTPAPASTAAPAAAGPAVLKSFSPLKLPRGKTTLVDVHGEGLRSDQRVAIQQKGRPAEQVRPGPKKLVDSGLLRVMIDVDPAAATGPYSLALLEPDGLASNPVMFEITK